MPGDVATLVAHMVACKAKFDDAHREALAAIETGDGTALAAARRQQHALLDKQGAAD